MNRQFGLSLIELLVSMMVGVFLIGGLATNLIGSSKLEKSRQAMSEVDSNAQQAMDAIRQAVSHTAYPTTSNIYLDKAFYSQQDGNLANPDCRGGGKRDLEGFTPESSDWTRDSGKADVLTVVSLTDNPCTKGKTSCPDEVDKNLQALVYVDCAGGGIDRDKRTVACSADREVGMNPPGEGKLFNTFRLDTQENTLICEGNRGGSSLLAENIHAMQFLYGVKNVDGETTYQNADSVENDNLWGTVNSVQVALLVGSNDKKIFDIANPESQYTLLDKTITVPDSDSHRLYRVYTMTIHLGNVR